MTTRFSRSKICYLRQFEFKFLCSNYIHHANKVPLGLATCYTYLISCARILVLRIDLSLNIIRSKMKTKK